MATSNVAAPGTAGLFFKPILPRTRGSDGCPTPPRATSGAEMVSPDLAVPRGGTVIPKGSVRVKLVSATAIRFPLRGSHTDYPCRKPFGIGFRGLVHTVRVEDPKHVESRAMTGWDVARNRARFRRRPPIRPHLQARGGLSARRDATRMNRGIFEGAREARRQHPRRRRRPE
jgi:hypothetical protein